MRRRTFSLLLAFSPLSLQANDNPSVKLDGVVSYYKPGERIAITLRPQVEKTYNLASKDTNYVIDPDVQVGSKVDMEEKKEADGRHTVSIRSKK